MCKRTSYNYFDSRNRQTHDVAVKLKEASIDFKNAGVNELVVDLPFNGGGAVSSCQLLASMITTESNVNTSFQRMYYNATITNKYYSAKGYADVPFLTTAQMKGEYYGNTVNGVRLALSRVYVLVSGQSASASEALIFGLRGAQNTVEVVVIGEQTVGKTVGMTLRDKTLGDYDYEMWPVSFVMGNSKGVKANTEPKANGRGGYKGGIVPDRTIREMYILGWKELGDPEEGLLAAAIYHMDNGTFPTSRAVTAAQATRANIALSAAQIDFSPTLRNGGMRDHRAAVTPDN